MRIHFVEHDSEWRVKRAQTFRRKMIAELLYAVFVTYCRIGVRRACGWLRWILATHSMHVIESLGLAVIGLKVAVRDGPSRRRSIVVLDLSKIFFAQAKQRRSIEL